MPAPAERSYASRPISSQALEQVYGLPVRVGRNPASGRPHVSIAARL